MPVPPTSGPLQPASNDPLSLRPRRAAAKPPVAGSQPAARPGRDRVHLSDLGRELAQAELRTGDGAELRVDLIARLRSEVLDGTYRPDAQALARAMVERGEQA